uniref:DUF2470 domain-containing protein n=1 Tax=Polytomella parva TaxID=51329 RepID=A0A7S0UY45_9CHLO|mmetsp:Transcript_22466/g.39857  ORF Transcript_22466/g.39857 Transcript_22466/m.39857 type:complete len:421 (+) Transcript_22466:75-1337(+)
MFSCTTNNGTKANGTQIAWLKVSHLPWYGLSKTLTKKSKSLKQNKISIFKDIHKQYLTVTKSTSNGAPELPALSNPKLSGFTDNANNGQIVNYPSTSETARTILSLCQEATISLTVAKARSGNTNGEASSKHPLSAPVHYFVGKDSEIFVNMPPNIQNLLNFSSDNYYSINNAEEKDNRNRDKNNIDSFSKNDTISDDQASSQPTSSSVLCCLTLRPSKWPARHLGSISITGLIETEPSTDVFDEIDGFGNTGMVNHKVNRSLTLHSGARVVRDVSAKIGQFTGRLEDSFKFKPLKCHFFSELDKRFPVVEINADEFLHSTPDILRHSFDDLAPLWNKDHPEDLAIVVAHFLGLPSHEVEFAEVVWVDRLGVFVYAEVLGRPKGILRVPFYRPVLSVRDARAVMTMTAQVAWEALNKYVI